MDQEQRSTPSEALPPAPSEEHYPFLILSVQLLASLMLGATAVVLYQGLATAVGWDTELISTGLRADAAPAERWQMRVLLALSHLLTFVLAGWAVVRLFYPPTTRALDYLRVRRPPQALVVGGAVSLMLLALPLVLYAYEWNRSLPIPDALRQSEAEANEMLKELLRMDNMWEFLANLVLIALLPAIGEELVFRGVVQQQLMRLVREPWVAILLAGAVFSFAHFQFEGFLPRLLLGVLLGWLYWRFQNFWVPAAAHFANNGLQVLAQYLYHRDVSTLNLEEDISVPVYLALFSAASVLYLARLLQRQPGANNFL